MKATSVIIKKPFGGRSGRTHAWAAGALCFLSFVGAAAPGLRDELKGFSNFVGTFKVTGQYETRGKDAFLSEVTCRWDFQAKSEKAEAAPSLIWEFGEDAVISKFSLEPLGAGNYRATAEGSWGMASNLSGKVAGDMLLVEGNTASGDGLRFSLQSLHPERSVIKIETRKGPGGVFSKWLRWGLTRLGSPVASDNPDGKECLITGGQGTRSVTYQGKTYYVCCGGCLDTFNQDPAKAVRDYEARRTGKK